MAKRGRPKLLKDPAAILVRVERAERELLEAFADLNGHSLNAEMQMAVRGHIRRALDDRGDEHVLATDPRKANAPQLAGNGANATTTHPKEEAGVRRD